MRLSGSQLRRLERGDYSPLIFDDEPYPCCVVLSWQREERHWDDSAGLIVVPRRPLRWLEVVSVKRHKRGGWQVRFDLRDRRDPARYLAPVDGYTTSEVRNIDELEVVPDKYQLQLTKAVQEANTELQERRRAGERSRRNHKNRVAYRHRQRAA